MAEANSPGEKTSVRKIALYFLLCLALPLSSWDALETWQKIRHSASPNIEFLSASLAIEVIGNIVVAILAGLFFAGTISLLRKRRQRA